MTRRILTGAIAALAATLLLVGCTASPTPAPEPSPDPNAVAPAPVLDASELDLYGGVARLSLATACTGTLIETGVDEAPAYLLTNGHCVGVDNMPANATILDEEGYGEARFFDVAGATDDDVLTVPAVRFEYGTMRGVDIGIVRLDATLGELRDGGAVPLPIAADAVAPGAAVVNIAAPTQNVPEDEFVLRKGECTLGESVDLIEHVWLWLDAPSNDCPGVLGGSSGSPLIADGEIVSIVNTTNTGVPVERGDTCYLGKPCEVEGAAAVFVPDTSYGVRTAGVGACFPEGVFALGGACPLEVAPLWDVNGGGIFGPNGEDGAGRTPVLELRSAVAAEVAVVQDVALGDASTCTDPATYAGASRVAVDADAEEPVTVPVTLPVENGFVLACAAVVGEESLAARFVFSIDAVAPTEGPRLAIEDLGETLMVDPLFDIPDIADIEVLFGPADEIDCADRAAYRLYIRQPFFIERDELPVRFCAVGFDMAGNESPLTERLLD